MKQTKISMGMPITVEIIDSTDKQLLNDTFAFFRKVDNRYSTYKPDSEISRINNGLPRDRWSAEMKKVMQLCEATKQETNGYFDIKHQGKLDPSGLVKGWAIWEAAKQLRQHGLQNFYIEAGGDVQAMGLHAHNQPWTVGIRNPFDTSQIVKTLRIHNKGVATSGTYIRGQHIYTPNHSQAVSQGVQSLTVIADNIYEADRFATAAFAMGKEGIAFIEQRTDLEGYMIDDLGLATFTSGFKEYIHA